MSMTRRHIIGVASTVAATGVLRGRADAAEFTYKFGLNTPDNHPMSAQARKAAALVLEQSSGRLQIETFPNSQLGSDTDMVSQVRSGALELFAAPSLTFSTLVAASGIPSVGFAFRTYDQVWAAMDGELGAYIRGAIGKVGLVPIARIWDNGFRQITSADKPIRTPADLKGMKIRVPVTALLTSLFKSLGAAPTSITLHELYSALQTHIVQGQENPLAQIETSNLYEVQKYCSLSNHCWSGYWIVAHKRTIDALPGELRDILTRNLDQAALDERADLAKLDATLQATLAQRGMSFERPDPAPFHDALRSAGFYTQWKKTYGDQAWSLLEKYAGSLG
jgi:tripartite ATP-independent transporter DctP family solute receptor